MKNITLIILLISFTVFSCSDDDPVDQPLPQNEVSTLNLEFNFKVGSEDLLINDREYVLNNEDTVIIDQFKFILSNLRLDGGDSWKDDEGYYLVKASDGSSSFQLSLEIKPGNYDKLSFYIGMDSAMNFKPESFPILFQQEGMYWDWNSGYKFLLLEGRYFSSELTTPNNSIGFLTHIGDMINLRIPEIEIEGGFEIKDQETKTLRFNVNIEEMYNNPNLIRLNEVNNRNVMGGSKASLISKNYESGMINLID